MWTAIIFGVFVIVLVISLSLRSSHSVANGDASNTYASRDMVIVSYSSLFCDGLSLRGSSQTEPVRGTLYLLDGTPPATRNELISFAKEPILQRHYEYWMFHLLPGSTIQLTACSSSSVTYPATFFLVRGVNNFARWESDGNTNYITKKLIDKTCPSGGDHQIFLSYKTVKEEQYYLIFENDYGSTHLKLTFNITQVLYSISKDMIVDNCSVLLNTHDSCSLPVSTSSSSKALLDLQPVEGSEVDWEANNVVDVHCHARVWIYVVLCLSGAGGIVLLVLTVAGICVFVHRRKRTTTTATSATTPAATTGTSFTAVANTDTPSAPPPPENTPLLFGTNEENNFEAPPAYKPASPAYKPAPPAYKP